MFSRRTPRGGDCDLLRKIYKLPAFSDIGKKMQVLFSHHSQQKWQKSNLILVTELGQRSGMGPRTRFQNVLKPTNKSPESLRPEPQIPGGMREATLCPKTFGILAQVSPNLPNPLLRRSSTPWPILNGKTTWVESSSKDGGGGASPEASSINAPDAPRQLQL